MWPGSLESLTEDCIHVWCGGGVVEVWCGGGGGVVEVWCGGGVVW